jgi:hypothetical protein
VVVRIPGGNISRLGFLTGFLMSTSMQRTECVDIQRTLARFKEYSRNRIHGSFALSPVYHMGMDVVGLVNQEVKTQI